MGVGGVEMMVGGIGVWVGVVGVDVSAGMVRVQAESRNIKSADESSMRDMLPP